MNEPNDRDFENSFAELVESLRRPTGPTRGSEWRGDEAVVLPASLDRKLLGFVAEHRRRGVRASRWPFARKPDRLLLLQSTRAQETFLVDLLARRLVRRTYSFDLREFADGDEVTLREALAPLHERTPCVVHLHRIEAAPYRDLVIAALACAGPHIAVIATASDLSAIDPSLARIFRLRLSWATEAGMPRAVGFPKPIRPN